MGGRGSSSGGRYGGGGLSPNDIVSTRDLISDRESNQKMVDAVMQSLHEVHSEYGVVLDGIHLATLKGKGANAMAYYSSDGTLGVNEAYFNSRMESAYDMCVKKGFHPKRGNKSAMEAVALHEMGHALTDKASKRLGHNNMDKTATFIVTEARKSTKHRGNIKMARKISTYATHSDAEAIAEAFSDVKCNGSRARAESKAIVRVLDKYTK